ncbi:MalM family protein [Ferrovibrio sp.]|uniref:MalM family protein n=1 Tax=Ferrovibrio sp. TaxID=1917215 RepID=UPI003D0E6984
MRQFFSLIAILAGLAGCVTQETARQQVSQLDAAKPCCTRLDELPFAKAPSGQNISVEITPASPVYEVLGRNRYIAAYELPADPKPAVLSLRSYFAYAPYQEHMPILHPSVLFLDANKQQIMAIDQSAFRYAREGLFEGAGLEARIQINTENFQPRYMVIYAGAIGQQDSRAVTTPMVMVPVMIGSVMVPMTSGGGAAPTLPMPTGSLRLSIREARN